MIVWRKGKIRVGRQMVPCLYLKGDDTIMAMERDGRWHLYLSRRLIQVADDKQEFQPTIERLSEGVPIVYPSESMIQVDIFK